MLGAHRRIDGAFTPKLGRVYGKDFDVDRHPVGTYRVELKDPLGPVGRLLQVKVGIVATRQDYQCVIREIADEDGVFTIETYKIGRKTKLAWPPSGSRVTFLVMYELKREP